MVRAFQGGERKTKVLGQLFYAPLGGHYLPAGLNFEPPNESTKLHALGGGAAQELRPTMGEGDEEPLVRCNYRQNSRVYRAANREIIKCH